VVGGFFGAALVLTFTIGMNNVASYLISIPTFVGVWIFCHKYFERLKKTETFETPVDIAQQPDRLSVVPTSEPPQRSGVRPMLKIRVSLKGRPLGMYTFNKDVITVGRDPTSDIHLDNINVAREQLRFEFGPSGYYTLVDLGIHDLTLLNEEPITRGYVYNNDVVRIGKYTLWIGFEAHTRHNVG
jgi:hypothetical protein